MDELSPIHQYPNTDSEDDWDFSLSDSDSESDAWDNLDDTIDPETFGNSFFSAQSTVPLDLSLLELL